METFSALLALYEGNPPVTGGFPSQMPVTRSFDVFFDLRLNKLSSKQSTRRWFETPSGSLLRHYKHAMADGFPSQKHSDGENISTGYPPFAVFYFAQQPSAL